MKTRRTLFPTCIPCILTLGAVLPIIAATAETETNAPAKAAQAIPWQQIGARAGADYKGEGLSVTPSASGARLHCVFQRLEGEATPEGLWLISNVTNTLADRFQVKATTVGRDVERKASERQSVEISLHAPRLPATGTVTIADGRVTFARPGLLEEYSVSMDGVRQDFIVVERPAGEGELKVELAVVGARVEATPAGARLLLEQSGRKIAYSRLRATDAAGKELPARVEVITSNSESTTQKGAMVLVVNDAGAVYPVRIDPTFSDDNWVSTGGLRGANGQVYAAVVDASGNLYIGGNFTGVGETAANYTAKWNGSAWSALGSGLNGWVLALAVSGSDLYAGGAFTMAGGTVVNSAAKWNGSAWSELGSGMNGGVRALAVSGSDLYAGGDFTMAGGSAANHVAKWNGNAWSELGDGVAPGYSTVYTLVVSGSDLYAGGDFTMAGGSAANYIAKWDGSAWSPLGSGMDYYGYVYALAVSGSDLYAGGDFTTAGGNPANYIAKWNGSTWSALALGMNSGVAALVVSGSDLYAGGYFTYATNAGPSPVNVNSVAKWNGSAWSALGSGMSGTVPAGVDALVVSGSDLYAGGSFGTAGGSEVWLFAKWNGSDWSALGLGLGLNSGVAALVVSGSDLYAGGAFTTAGGRTVNYIAKWNGQEWAAVGLGLNNGVNALVVSGSDLYVGGYFTYATNAGPRAVQVNYVAKWDGSAWSALGEGMGGTYPYVYALAVAGSDLYVGGDFTYATNAGSSAVQVNCIAKFDGSAWSALGEGMGGTYVYTLAVSGSDLYAGGDFSYATNAGPSPVNVNCVAKWNGNAWSALGRGMGGYGARLYAPAVAGSDLYAGGVFTWAGAYRAKNIAKWNGNAWSALGPGMNDSVYALAVAGSDLYAGGYFTYATNAGPSAVNVNRIAKWNGQEWSALGSGMNGTVSAITVLDSDLYAGGSFTTVGGKVSAYLTKAIAVPGDWLQIQKDVPGPKTNTLSYVGVPNAQYLVQFATNVTTSPWLTLATNTVAPNGRGILLDCGVTNAQRFYRISTP